MSYSKRRLNPWFVGSLVGLTLGAVLLLSGYGAGERDRRIDANPGEADGVVLEVSELVDVRAGREDQHSFTPRVRFELPNGILQGAELAPTTERDQYRAGDVIAVEYDTTDPRTARDAAVEPGDKTPQIVGGWIVASMGLVVFAWGVSRIIARRDPMNYGVEE